MRPIGYYVHHHGAGHRQRAVALASWFRRPCILLGSALDVDRAAVPMGRIELPDDRLGPNFDGSDGERNAPEALHYAPLGHPGIRTRMAAIARWIAEADPVLMIVDVSVEIALFARLMSVPTVVVRLAGDRTDPPHLESFRAAEALIAPFPAALDATTTPEWVRAKTIYAGFLAPPVPSAKEDGRIVVVLGRGGVAVPLNALAQAARAVPERAWHVLGASAEAPLGTLPPNLHVHGWVEDVASVVAPASLLVGGGGDGVVSLAVAAGKRFVCLPEERPFGEQISKAQGLARHGLAIVHEGWPAPAKWPVLVEAGLALDPSAIRRHARPDALERLAAEIDRIAASREARSEQSGRREPGGFDLV